MARLPVAVALLAVLAGCMDDGAQPPVPSPPPPPAWAAPFPDLGLLQSAGDALRMGGGDAAATVPLDGRWHTALPATAHAALLRIDSRAADQGSGTSGTYQPIHLAGAFYAGDRVVTGDGGWVFARLLYPGDGKAATVAPANLATLGQFLVHLGSPFGATVTATLDTAGCGACSKMDVLLLVAYEAPPGADGLALAGVWSRDGSGGNDADLGFEAALARLRGAASAQPLQPLALADAASLAYVSRNEQLASTHVPAGEHGVEVTDASPAPGVPQARPLRDLRVAFNHTGGPGWHETLMDLSGLYAGSWTFTLAGDGGGSWASPSDAAGAASVTLRDLRARAGITAGAFTLQAQLDTGAPTGTADPLAEKPWVLYSVQTSLDGPAATGLAWPEASEHR